MYSYVCNHRSLRKNHCDYPQWYQIDGAPSTPLVNFGNKYDLPVEVNPIYHQVL